MSTKEGALSGVRLLSFAQMAQGPSAVQYLADMGADVIKIERPRTGGLERTWTALQLHVGGESAFFLGLNRNQRSLTVNLKSDRGREIIHRLAAGTDVLLENFRPGVMDRLGIGYDALSEINPGLIYAVATGYGSDGPYRKRPGQDLLAQAMGGLASMTGTRDDLPTPAGAAIVDVHSSALLTMAILAALFHRQQSGKGQKVEANLLESAIDLQKEALFYYMNGGGSRATTRSASGIGAPFYEAPHGIYRTRDGHIAIALNPLDKLGRILGIEEIRAFGPREAFDRRDEVKERIQRVLETRTTSEWLELMDAEDVWCSAVNDYDRLVEDPQVRHNRVLRTMEREDIGTFRVVAPPFRMSATPPDTGEPPPRLGQHTEEILGSLGYGREQIDEMREQGVV